MKKSTTFTTSNSRRGFLKKAGLGGLSLGFLLNEKLDQQMEFLTQNVNRHSAPADLRITDMRIA